MATLLNTTDPNNRLIEALGSAALFSDNTSAASPLGLPLNVLDLGGSTDTSTDGDQASTSGQATTSLDVASLLGAVNGGDAGLTDALPLDQVTGSLPVIGDSSLPIIGDGGLAGIVPSLDLGNGGGPLAGITPALDLGTIIPSLDPGTIIGSLPVIGDGGLGGIGSGGGPLAGGTSALNLGHIVPGLDLGTILGGTPGSSTSPGDLVGSGAPLQPVADPVNGLVKDVHYILEALSDQTGTATLVHSITSLGETIGLGEIGLAPSPDGSSNLVTDTLNLPGDILAGNLDGGIANISHDLTETIHATTNVVDNLLFGGQFPQFADDPSNPVPEIIGGVGHSLSSLPLLNINGSSNGGLLSGVVGDLSHSSSGHLVDADVGPQQSNGLVFDLLSTPGSDSGHTASVNAVDVGPNGPHLADLGILTGSGTSLPVIGSADGLAGNVLGDHGLLGGSLLGGLSGGAAPTAAVTTIVAEVTDIAPNAGGLGHGLLDLHGAHII